MNPRTHEVIEKIAAILKYASASGDGLLRVEKDMFHCTFSEIEGPAAISLKTHVIELLQVTRPDLPPISISRTAGVMQITAGGMPMALEEVEKKLAALDLVLEIEGQFRAEGGGENVYYIGYPGRNLPVDNLASISADSPEGACLRFIASRIDLGSVECVSNELDPKVSELTMRRAHDFRKYDFAAMVRALAPLIDLEIDRRIEIRQEADPGLWLDI